MHCRVYFSGISLRKTSKRLVSIKRNYTQIWKWIQRYKPRQTLQKRKRKKISEFIIDEILIKVGNMYAWIWVAIEPTDKGGILGIHFSFERTMLVAEQFLKYLINRCGKHAFSSDSGI